DASGRRIYRLGVGPHCLMLPLRDAIVRRDFPVHTHRYLHLYGVCSIWDGHTVAGHWRWDASSFRVSLARDLWNPDRSSDQHDAGNLDYYICNISAGRHPAGSPRRAQLEETESIT